MGMFKKAMQAAVGKRTPKPDGEEVIRERGHRQYVGGMWDEIGKLQFDFLVKQGLQPADCLLDIACGSLRGGVHFIRYLDAGNYLGIDKERTLIEAGIAEELGQATCDDKQPEFVLSGAFEFERFSKKPRFSLAQSLFTHLIPSDIDLCLRKLRQFVEPGHVLLATFQEGSSAANPDTSHANKGFKYSREEMTAFGEKQGFKATYIGDWNHPRGQMMMRYEAVDS